MFTGKLKTELHHILFHACLYLQFLGCMVIWGVWGGGGGYGENLNILLWVRSSNQHQGCGWKEFKCTVLDLIIQSGGGVIKHTIWD